MILSPESFHTLYNGITQPVLLLQDGLLATCNPAAAPFFQPGEPITAYLPDGEPFPSEAAQHPAALQLHSGPARFCAVTQPIEEALLLFVSAAHDDERVSAVLSHAAQAISTPLTSLLSVSSAVLPLLADAEDPYLQQNLSVMSRAGYQLLRISRHLSALGTRPALHREMTDLADFLDDLCLSAGELFEQTDRTLESQLPQAPVYAMIDRQLLQRAILALLSNAIKFTVPGSVVHLSMTRSGRRAALRISDCGEGMDSARLASAFSRFAEPPEPDDPRFGAGFSLPLVQAVVQAHGGTVLLQSQPGEGTDVLLSLPVGTPEDPSLLKSPSVHVDQSGGFSPALVELSDVLPPELFDVRNFM